MRIDVVTLFPGLIETIAAYGISGRARERKLWRLRLWNPRDFTTDNHKTVDDRPYGGGPGMVMLPGPLGQAIRAAKDALRSEGAIAPRAVLLSPAGEPLTHRRVMELATAPDPAYVLVAGRYEGVDERVVAREIDDEISVGDFVVSGGELPAMMLVDAIVRQLPGALNDAESAVQDSFVDGLLDCPHYTRPEVFEGMAVPPVLLSGNHAEIRRWRLQQALARTSQRRPELLAKHKLTGEEQRLLAEWQLNVVP